MQLARSPAPPRCRRDGDRARGLAERAVRGHVSTRCAVDEHLPSVIERAKIVRSGSAWEKTQAVVRSSSHATRCASSSSGAGLGSRLGRQTSPTTTLQPLPPGGSWVVASARPDLNLPAAISSTSFAGVTGVCAMRTPKGCSASSMAEIDRGRGRDGADLARALGAERIERRRRLLVERLDRRHLDGGRQQIVGEGRGDRLAASRRSPSIRTARCRCRARRRRAPGRRPSSD